MKIFILLLFVVVSLFFIAQNALDRPTSPPPEEGSSQLIQVTAKIDGMVCEGCSNHLQEKIEAINDVVKASFNHQTGKALITCKSEPNLTNFKQLIEDSGYSCLEISLVNQVGSKEPS